MLYKGKTLKGYTLRGLDGEIGKVEEFYFDDQYWVIRYLVADTGNWLTGREVLISPYAFGAVNEKEQYITIDLTKKQIEGSPSLNSDKPVSRQFEETYRAYYGFPPHFGGPHMLDSYQDTEEWDPHLRSTREVSSYRIQASDDEIGYVNDFIIDDEMWVIRYLIIDTQKWWSGKKVLISPQWIGRISWDKSKVFVNLSRETIKQSPEYTEESLLTREYETVLHQYYNRQGYWVDE